VAEPNTPDLTQAINAVDLPALIAELYPESGARAGHADTIRAVWRGEENPSVSLYRRKGGTTWLFKDQARNLAGNAYHFLTKVHGLGPEEARREIFASVTAEDIQKAQEGIPGDHAQGLRSCASEELSADQKRRHLQAVKATTTVPAILRERRFSLEEMQRLFIAADGDDVLMPILDPDGRLVNIKRRYHDREKAPGRARFKGLTGHGSPAWCSPGFRDHQRVLIIEGEMNGMAVHLALPDLFAVMAPAGASQYLYLEALKGKDVFIYADGDDAGRQAQGKWAADAREAGARSVRSLPRQEQDACDVVAAEGREALAKLYRQWLVAAGAAPPAPPGYDFDVSEFLSYPMTDLGDARRFLLLHQGEIYHVPERGQWLVWEGNRWRFHPDSYAWQRVVALGEVTRNVAEGIQDEDAKKLWMKHAAGLESTSKARRTVTMLQNSPKIILSDARLDAHPHLMNLANGTLNLRTGFLQAHDRNDMLTKMSPVEYDPEAEAPLWEAFQHRICCGDEELIEFKQRAMGYSISSSTREQCFFIAHGTGANGKSVEQNVLSYVIGDYSKPAEFSTFASRQHTGGPRPEVIDLAGARTVFVNEGNFSERLDEAQIKKITGGDTLKTRLLYSNMLVEIDAEWKIWMATNHKPPVIGTEAGIWRRVKFIPYNAFIKPHERDPNMAEKLRAEASGILNWLISGYQKWDREGLTNPEVVQASTQEYRDENDPLHDFLEEMTERMPGEEVWVKFTDLWQAYLKWVDHERTRPVTKRTFANMLSERGFNTDVRKHQRVRMGLRLTGYAESVMAGLVVEPAMKN